MNTITVDDRELIVTLMLGILQKLDPGGSHFGSCDAQEALRQATQFPPDVAFLDVEIPGEINGLELGKKLKELYPKLNIVIITGYRDGIPLDFSYSKSKELLACLIDHNGAICSNDTLIGCLWPDEPAGHLTKARLRKYVKDLRDTFARVGVEGVLQHQERIGIGLDVSRLDCDYFHYLQGDSAATCQFRGKYMTQYAFAEETRAELYHAFTQRRVSESTGQA